MSTLLRASELAKLPVVTFAGEDVAQIKDILYAADGGQIDAFTLAGRSLFSGPLKVALPWAGVVGLGSDALIIQSDQQLVPVASVLSGPPGDGAGGAPVNRGDIISSQVLTDQGTSLGVVSDVIIGISAGNVQADVIGYEIRPAETLGRGQQRLLIPLPDTMSASGEHLMVPAAAANFLSDNIIGFEATVAAFRAQIGAQG
ncbi:MAG: PRC-barrel domain-containing protein [Actinomycetota bacterium]|nr:PRC-barrel domain-containing protein [Actinomycetota bacterium]